MYWPVFLLVHRYMSKSNKMDLGDQWALGDSIVNMKHVKDT